MRTIDVYNREQFRMLKPDPKACVISCQTPPTTWGEGTLCNISDGWVNFVVLEFHDVIQESSPEIVVFDAEMADKIVRFVEWADNRNRSFVIHCDAGQSRSVAIGLWLSQYLGHMMLVHDEETPLRPHAAPHAGSYNSTVLRELRRAGQRYWYPNEDEYHWPEK